MLAAATQVDRIRLPTGADDRRGVREKRKAIWKQSPFGRDVALDLDAAKCSRGFHRDDEMAVTGDGHHRKLRIQDLSRCDRRLLTERELQTAGDRREHGSNPGCGKRQERVGAMLALALLVRPVVRQQRDGSGKQCQRQCRAHHREQIQRQRHPGLRQPAKGVRQEIMQR